MTEESEFAKELEELEKLKQSEARAETEAKQKTIEKAEIKESEEEILAKRRAREEKQRKATEKKKVETSASEEKLKEQIEKQKQAVLQIQEGMNVVEGLRNEIEEIKEKYKIAKEDNDKLISAIGKVQDKETIIDNSKVVLREFINKFNTAWMDFNPDGFIKYLARNFDSTTRPEHAIRYFEREFIKNNPELKPELKEKILRIGDSRKGNNRWNADANLITDYFNHIKEFLQTLYDKYTGNIAGFLLDLTDAILEKNKKDFDEGMKEILKAKDIIENQEISESQPVEDESKFFDNEIRSDENEMNVVEPEE